MTERYTPDWGSLRNHGTPKWLRDDKFGIYTHWGIYSVPERGPNGTWYPHNMYRPGNGKVIKLPTTKKPSARRRSLATKTLSQCLQLKNLIRPNGPGSSRRRVHDLPAPLLNITTVFQCGITRSMSGTQCEWGQNAMSLASSKSLPLRRNALHGSATPR